MVDEKRSESAQERLRWPSAWEPHPDPWDPNPDPWVLHWDRVPSWVELDDKMQRQFAQMELKFMKMELDIQQQKLQELGKILGTPTR